MTLNFKCKTGEAYYIKVLAELLTNNLKTGCFEVGEDGVVLRMFDHHRITLVDLELLSENFCVFKLKNNENLNLGLNLNHFHKMLKSIKKKDSLKLYITESNPTELVIKTIPKENTRITTSGIKIQNIQNLDIDIPTGYGKPIIVPSAEFQKMCKDLGSIGSTNITVRAKGYHIDFLADADGILKRKVTFGEDEDSDDDPGSAEVVDEYVATFSTEQLSRVTKLAGLSNILQIFPTNNLPLMFRSSVGNLGKISVYIKSKESLEHELRDFESDAED